MSIPPRLTGDEYRARLVSSGLSSTSIEGILKICADGNESFSKFGATPSFHDAIEFVTKLFVDLENFVKTQATEDQEAYGEMCERRKEEYN